MAMKSGTLGRMVWEEFGVDTENAKLYGMGLSKAADMWKRSDEWVCGVGYARSALLQNGLKRAGLDRRYIKGVL